MTDLIRRMDAIQACQVGPSDEWARATKDGYNQAATDCQRNILRIEPAPNAGAVKVKPLVGWVIANGQDNRWRCVWKWETNAEWTDDISKALKFATREDAEAFSAEDEDAWRIQEVPIPAIEPTPDPRDAVIARLVEAAELADAALRGANMNMNVVQAKMSAALAAAKEVMK